MVLIYYDILNFSPENIKLLEDNFDVIFLPDPSHDTPETLAKASVIFAPLGYYFGKQKIDASFNLKVIGSNTTGHQHIDVFYGNGKGIKVVTLKNQRNFLDTITPTAELTWGLVIAITRNIIPAFSSVLEGQWSRWPFGGKSMLSRMRLGVVGLGRLGKMVATYGACFGMKVQYYDPFVKNSMPGVEHVDSLSALVKSNDVLTVHVPHEPATEKMFNREMFSMFKPRAFFINTSRGELVDETALLKALESGRLAGAAIDVIEGEFEPGYADRISDNPLIRYAAEHQNLIITPHIGGSTEDAWRLTQEHIIRTVIHSFKRHNSNKGIDRHMS